MTVCNRQKAPRRWPECRAQPKFLERTLRVYENKGSGFGTETIMTRKMNRIGRQIDSKTRPLLVDMQRANGNRGKLQNLRSLGPAESVPT